MEDEQNILPPSVLDPRHVLVLHCPKCAFLTLSLNRLVEHCSLVHSREACSVRLLQCGVCRLVCSNGELLREHASTWHNLAAEGVSPARELCFVRINTESNTHRCKRRCHEQNEAYYFGANVGSSSDLESSCDGQTKQLFAHHCLFCEFETAESDALREHYGAVHDVHNITSRTAGSALRFSRNVLDESQSQTPFTNVILSPSSSTVQLHSSRDKIQAYGEDSLMVKVTEEDESRTEAFANEEELEDTFMERNVDEIEHVDKDIVQEKKDSFLLSNMRTDGEDDKESLVFTPRDCIGGMQCHICGAHYPHRKGFTEHLRKKHQIYVSKEPLSLIPTSSSPVSTTQISASSLKSINSECNPSIVVQSPSSDLNKLTSGQVRCAYCRGWFAASYLHRHRRKMHPDRPPQTFARSMRETGLAAQPDSVSTRESLSVNTFNVAAGSQYRCPLVRCGRVCATAYSLKRHLKRAHKIKSPSGYGHLQQTIKLLKKEQQQQKPEEEENCCASGNDSNSLPNKNRLPSPSLPSPSIAAPESSDLLRCPVCCAGFSHPSSLRRHQKLNSHDIDDADCQNDKSTERIEEITSDVGADDPNEGHFPCLLCSSNFRFEVDLRKHTGSAHAFADWRTDDVNSLGITCKCGSSMRSMHAFREHVLSQHLHQSLSCRWCDKEFPLLHALCSHAGQCAARPRSLYV